MEKSKILIDLFGADDVDAVIHGVALALNRVSEVDLVVTGDKAYIEEKLSMEEFDKSRLEIIDAPEVVTNDDSPVSAVWKKRNSSLVKGVGALNDREDIKAMITAGSTGALIASAVLILGRANPEHKPTLITLLPNEKGGFTCIADCGANVDCPPEQMAQFARYGSRYMQKVYGIESPKVALLSVGTEDKKGNKQSLATFDLLKESDLNFVGNMEGKTVLTGDADVIVCDGFSGNVLLKSVEGTAKVIAKKVIYYVMKHAGNADTSFVKSALGDFMNHYDFNSLAGSVLIGIKKPIIKAHGSANSETVVNTVKQALEIVKSGFSLKDC